MAPVSQPSLWMRFVTIAQPYFLPKIAGGGKLTLLLMAMLLLALFGLLFITVSLLVLAGNLLAPELTARLAGGLLATIQGVLQSWRWLLVAGCLILPAGIFAWQRRNLRERRGAWLLLAVVLLLSLSVTGINVAFSYIGNYFTNALVAKNQDHVLSVCRCLFLRLSGRYSHRGVLWLCARLHGHALAQVDDRRLVGQVFRESQLLRHRSRR
jgi:hypothetical protein